MKKILIHNDNGRRDLLGLRLLEKSLVSKGFKVYFSGRTTLRPRLRRIRPDAVIMARGDNPNGELASAVCPVYVVPGEGGRITKETTLAVFLGGDISGIRPAPWVKRCYLWNENTKGWLLETGMLTPPQIKVVGNPRMDLYRRRDYKELFKKRKEGAPLRIGIAFSATSTSQIWGPMHLARSYHDLRRDRKFSILPPGNHIEDMVWRDHAILRNMMHVIKDIGEETSYEMTLRPNPMEAISEYRFLEKRYPGRLRVLFKETLPEFLSNIDVLLTCWSTTGIEALLNGIPVITITGFLNQERLFDHISKEASSANPYAQQYHNPKDPDELMALLELAKDNKLAPSPKEPEETASMIREVYGWEESQPSSCDEIAEDIANDLASSNNRRVGNRDWRKALPLPKNLPPRLAEIAINLRDVLDAKKSGEFRSYMSFLRCNDPYVARLLRKVSF